MTFEPVLPVAVLVITGVALLAIRAVTLPAALRHIGSRRYGRLLRWSGLTAAVLLIVLAAARPSVGKPMAATPAAAGGSDTNVFFVVDRSVDSRVEDLGPNTSRMAGIRTDMAALIDQYPRARFAMISFSSRASLDWPLSDDVWSLKAMVAGLQSYTAATPDTTYQVNAAAASDVLRYKLQQAQFQFPHSKNVVFYFGEGAGGSRAPQSGFDLGSAKVAGGAVLGYGTPAGGPIPQAVVNGAVVYAVDAQTGDELGSALNEPALTAIANQLGIRYVHRDNGPSLAPVTTARSTGGAAEAAPAGQGPVELYWVCTWAAAALILVEIYLTIRQYRRHRVARTDMQP
ncbi:MAG: VWA domain-containing protein [Mycobacteriaceae bacterium]|nr:VWA domain-containing protein [Mycobacteriaceae bacterium]MBV9638408.1 VWA domain-containing protein [Mycobacteriaceae bacterium]